MRLIQVLMRKFIVWHLEKSARAGEIGSVHKPYIIKFMYGPKISLMVWRKRIFKYAYVIPWRKKESRSREEQYPTSHASFICHQGSLNC